MPPPKVFGSEGTALSPRGPVSRRADTRSDKHTFAFRGRHWPKKMTGPSLPVGQAGRAEGGAAFLRGAGAAGAHGRGRCAATPAPPLCGDHGASARLLLAPSRVVAGRGVEARPVGHLPSERKAPGTRRDVSVAAPPSPRRPPPPGRSFLSTRWGRGGGVSCRQSAESGARDTGLGGRLRRAPQALRCLCARRVS